MLVTALLAKNEAGKYLERVLRRCHEFSDEVLVLDDGSTDETVAIARKLGCGVKLRQETGMWGNEAPARAELWDWGAEVAGDGWLLICDADMLLVGDPRPLTLTTQCTAATVQSSSSRSFNSASVRSGSRAMSCFNFTPWTGISLAFRPENRCRGLRSPVLALWPSSFFTIPTETLKRFATSSLVPSFAS